MPDEVRSRKADEQQIRYVIPAKVLMLEECLSEVQRDQIRIRRASKFHEEPPIRCNAGRAQQMRKHRILARITARELRPRRLVVDGICL